MNYLFITRKFASSRRVNWKRKKKYHFVSIYTAHAQSRGRFNWCNWVYAKTPLQHMTRVGGDEIKKAASPLEPRRMTFVPTTPKQRFLSHSHAALTRYIYTVVYYFPFAHVTDAVYSSFEKRVLYMILGRMYNVYTEISRVNEYCW